MAWPHRCPRSCHRGRASAGWSSGRRSETYRSRLSSWRRKISRLWTSRTGDRRDWRWPAQMTRHRWGDWWPGCRWQGQSRLRCSPARRSGCCERPWDWCVRRVREELPEPTEANFQNARWRWELRAAFSRTPHPKDNSWRQQDRLSRPQSWWLPRVLIQAKRKLRCLQPLASAGSQGQAKKLRTCRFLEVPTLWGSWRFGQYLFIKKPASRALTF